MKTSLSTKAILNQAQETCQLTGEYDASSAWNFAYATWSAAAENDEPVPDLAELEEAFNNTPIEFWSGE